MTVLPCSGLLVGQAPWQWQLLDTLFCFHLAITGREGLQAVLDSLVTLQVSAREHLGVAKCNYGKRNGSFGRGKKLTPFRSKQTNKKTN